MENSGSKGEQQTNQQQTYSNVIEEQTRINAEALRRASNEAVPRPEPNYVDGLLAATAMDMWSTGGAIDHPHVSPDLQGPTRALQFGDQPGPPVGAPMTWNFADIIRFHGGR
jgi:hypothetical protein